MTLERDLQNQQRRQLIRCLGGTAAVSVALGVSPAGAQAQPTSSLERIRQSGTLRVNAISGSAPSWIKNPQSGQWSGFETECAQDLAKILSVKAEFVETTWGNLAADLQSNRIDIAMGVGPNPSRALTIDYVPVALYQSAFTIILRPGVEQPGPNWIDFNKPELTLVVTQGSTGHLIAMQIVPKVNLVTLPNAGEALLAMKSKRVDGWISTLVDGLALTARHELGTLLIPKPVIGLPGTFAVKREPGNSSFLNFLTVYCWQQQSAGFGRAKVLRSLAEIGIDESKIPAEANF